MKENKYKREDLKCIANKLGYNLYYKGHSIGGAGIKGDGAYIKGQKAEKQTKDNLESGMREINHIVLGIVMPHQKLYMEEIDQKIESGEWKYEEI